ncbi:hypothetical protein IAU60_004424 [Kwoniella sp. DSM 27419]
MIMTSSPVLTPHSRSLVHTPSPSSSPKLRPVASTMATSPAVPNMSTANSTPLNLSASLPTRSFVRGPQARPYNSPLRGSKGRPVEGDSKRFVDMVAAMVNDAESHKRKGELIEMIENISLEQPSKPTHTRAVTAPIKSKSAAASVAGSWETERAELIVDIPVWSPGCFQDLSTLHALRDTTLSHTHALMSHLLNAHSVPATYRLLARSCVAPGKKASRYHHGWGCIRLAPSVSSPISAHHELKPKIRRSSLVMPSTSPNSRQLHQFMRPKVKHSEEMSHDSVIVDSDDERDVEVNLREGYQGSRAGGSSVSSDSEDDDETADSVVAREIDRRGGKEGMAFLMTLFGQPALILT